MAIPKTHFFVLFVLFSLFFILNFKVSSATLTGYDKWLSWHVDNFKNKTVFETTRGVFGSVESRIDLKLSRAERNKRYIIVSQDRSGDFRTIKDAVSSIPVSNKGRVILSIKQGLYREKIVIEKKIPFVTLKAEDYNNLPTITWNDTCNSTGKTFRSATVAINSDYFVAININFENTVKHERGVIGSQAAALRISGTKGAFYNCTFTGYQDTLYDHKGLHYFKDCSISGDVDFICGYGQSLYESCLLNFTGNNDGGSITSQKRTATSISSGFSFKNCTVKGTNNNSVYLGRSWGNQSRVVLSYTYMDNIVIPQGWDDWTNPNNDNTTFYGEYKCSGPGSNTSGRVPWARTITDREAEPFIGKYFVEGDTWILDPY